MQLSFLILRENTEISTFPMEHKHCLMNPSACLVSKHSLLFSLDIPRYANASWWLSNPRLILCSSSNISALTLFFYYPIGRLLLLYLFPINYIRDLASGNWGHSLLVNERRRKMGDCMAMRAGVLKWERPHHESCVYVFLWGAVWSMK